MSMPPHSSSFDCSSLYLAVIHCSQEGGGRHSPKIRTKKSKIEHINWFLSYRFIFLFITFFTKLACDSHAFLVISLSRLWLSMPCLRLHRPKEMRGGVNHHPPGWLCCQLERRRRTNIQSSSLFFSFDEERGGLAHLGPNTRTAGKRGMLLGGSPNTQEKKPLWIILLVLLLL